MALPICFSLQVYIYHFTYLHKLIFISITTTFRKIYGWLIQRKVTVH